MLSNKKKKKKNVFRVIFTGNFYIARESNSMTKILGSCHAEKKVEGADDDTGGLEQSKIVDGGGGSSGGGSFGGGGGLVVVIEMMLVLGMVEVSMIVLVLVVVLIAGVVVFAVVVRVFEVAADSHLTFTVMVCGGIESNFEILNKAVTLLVLVLVGQKA